MEQLISQLLQEHRKDLWELIQKNNSTKQKMKSIESFWKQIEVILSKDFKSLMK